MKKLFYLLFISSLAFGSCTKQEPIEVTCDCSGDSGIDVDNSLVGYWINTDGLNQSLAIGTDFSGNYYGGSYNYGGFYSCDGNSHLSFTSLDGIHSWTSKYSISGNIMTLTFYEYNITLSEESATYEKQ